ncbi:MAG: hypothetical protein KA715_11280 [Xanthomonadaceae bacterium]|nr:hypothetical protein [Xanthomonadaceae bacterium]
MKVAEEIISFCTKCKIDLAHAVVAMQGDRAVRVMCKTCKGEHAYRAPKGITDPSMAPKKKSERVSKTVVTVAEDWETKMALHKNSPVKDYSTKNQYKAGERIEHPSFGTGLVEKLIHPNKIEVIFKTEIKMLICAPSN